jgi:CRISPR-associated endonuclease/helicase Cas3
VARANELFLRLLFSALVDADSLDTERHGSPERADLRGHDVSLDTLCQRLDAALAAFPPSPSASVQAVRAEILGACRLAADLPTGMFRLAAPTGGGKTLSGLAFALRHASRHGLQRVVVAVPFISITEQTAGVYRSVLGAGDDAHPVVLEHHSGSRELVHGGTDSAGGDFRPNALWGQLAAENWDAPVVVTTTVQLFESLFGRTRTACRKLHRLARSVIVLDEVQALPVPLLDPILDVLRELCEHYGATVVLSTATQPAFDTVPALKALPARDILPDPAPLFRRLARVHYDWRTDEPLSWPAVADLIGTEAQALAILNTKKDALALLDVLRDAGRGEALHLSTLLCGAHRRRVLADVRGRLRAGDHCLLVSTQVVEAGVDVDFPLVLRALGPLDGIIQAAGRCNREGRLGLGDEARGRLVVFRPEGGGMPPGVYKLGAQIAEMLAAEGRRDRTLDPNDPGLYRRYSELLLRLAGTDGANIQRLRASLDYPDVARAFRMIDDDTESVVITDYGTDDERRQVRALLDGLRAPRRSAVTPRAALRMLQPYVVTVRRREAKAYRQRGLLEDIQPAGRPDAEYGLAEWHGRYDSVRGIEATGASADAFVV